MSFGHLPFDEQVCGLWVASYSQTAAHVALAGDLGGISLAEVTSVEWEVAQPDAVQAVRRIARHGGDFSYVDLTFRLRRLRAYYVINVLVPGLTFTLISWTGFFIHYSVAPARVAIAVIPVLILTTLRNGVFAALPRVSYRIWLTDLLFLSLLFSTAAVIHYGIISALCE